MKHSLFFIGILFLYHTLSSQNLVPNGDFEFYTQIPNQLGQISFAKPWFSPPKYAGCKSEYLNSNSLNPYLSTPVNVGGSFQYPHSGQGYSCLSIFSLGIPLREYIEVQLTDTLKPNKCYHISFYLSLLDVCKYRTNNINALFSKDSIIDSTFSCSNLQYIPQIIYNGAQWIDTISWYHFDETFMANGGEHFLTIGNFFDNDHTFVDYYNPNGTTTEALYYIDDVSVYPCDAPIVTANAGADTEICPGDNITIGMPHYNYYKYKWFEADGTLIDTTSSITVSPLNETSYILWIKDFLNQESYDTVTVRIKDCSPEPSAEIPNIFTPNSDGHNDLFYVKGNKIEKLNLIIFNRWGSKVFEGNDPQAAWDGKYNKQPCAEGVYYYVAGVTFTDGRSETRKGSVTLMR
jgi:gliding motility-associated-like protein